jgi:hypothetical protein
MTYDFLRNGDNKLNEGVSEDLLRHVESALGVPVPRAWQDFLRFSNGAVLSDEIRLFPARRDPAPDAPEDDEPEEDLISANLDPDELHGLDEKVLVIGRYCDSDLFCYLRADAGKDDPPIYFFNHEECELEKDSENALDFLRKCSVRFRSETIRKEKRALLFRQTLAVIKLLLIVAGILALVTGLAWLLLFKGH